jgi:TolB-like protein
LTGKKLLTPGTIPSCGVEASRLRSKLKEYYENEGKDDDLIIELPKGSYLAKIQPSQASLGLSSGLSRNKLMAVAVLPFLSLSKDSRTAMCADAGLDWVYVVPRTSVFRFKHQCADVQAIAKQLGVTVLLEGSVRRTGTAVCIKIRLINILAISNRQLGTYNAQLDDKYSTTKLCARVVSALELETLSLSTAQ